MDDRADRGGDPMTARNRKPKAVKPTEIPHDLDDLPPEKDIDPLTAARWRPIAEVIPWDRNPRRNDAAAEEVAGSIARFGFVAPISVWTSRARVVAGHTRLKAMQLLLSRDPGFTPPGAPGPGLVPVREHEFTSEQEANAYALADNKLGELADWDEASLAAIVADLQQSDIPLDGLGFPSSELEALIASTRPEDVTIGIGAAFGALPDGAPERVSMTFTLTADQRGVVEEAMKAVGIAPSEENRNAWALTQIAQAFLATREEE
jgi:ParB-like chromosome segregation protein Spo0J